MNYEKAMTEARKRAKGMDAIDARQGYSTPEQMGNQEIARTAFAAIKAGIAGDDWSCVADAQVLIEKLKA